jgi:hypothetical protein
MLVAVAGLPGGCARPAPFASEFVWFEAAGWGLGRELAKDMPSGGQVLFWSGNFSDATYRGIRDAYLKGLKRSAGSGFDFVLSSSAAGAPRTAMEMRMNAGGFAAALRAALPSLTNAVAVVAPLSMAELPAPADLRGLPPLYILDASSATGWEEAVRSGRAAAAVVARADADRGYTPQASDGPETLFRARFVAVTRR